MSNDALERIKQRQRPSVPVRDLSLISDSIDTSISSNLESESDISLSSVIPSSIKGQKLGAINSIKTKQTTIRLEVKVSERLSSICRANDLSREVFIEALFEHYEGDTDAWNKILIEAKIKGEQRQNLANLKRAHSMMQRFGE